MFFLRRAASEILRSALISRIKDIPSSNGYWLILCNDNSPNNFFIRWSRSRRACDKEKSKFAHWANQFRALPGKEEQKLDDFNYSRVVLSGAR